MTLTFTQRAFLLGPALALAYSGVAVDTFAQATPDARAIMQKVADGKRLDGSEALVKLVLDDGKGGVKEHKLKMATKLYDEGKTEKRVIRFLNDDVKGTGVLVFDYADETDDVWVYTPALRKTRRMVSAQKAQSFMGSEFTYADFNTPAVEDYTYKLLRDEAASGEDCYVVELSPKTKDVMQTDGYAKKVYWVSKATHTVRRGVYYDAVGAEVKELSTSNVKLVDKEKKRYRALKLEMANKKNGRKSTFETEKFAFTPNTNDEYFTVGYLEKP